MVLCYVDSIFDHVKKIVFYRITKTRCSSLQNAHPFPLLRIDLYLREVARLSHTTASRMNTPKVKNSSVYSASFSQGGLLAEAMEVNKKLLRNAVGDNCLWWVHSSWASSICGK